MSHHFKAPRTYSVDDFASLLGVGDLEFLLKEDGSLLVGRLDDSGNEEIVRRGGGRMQQRQEIDRLRMNVHLNCRSIAQRGMKIRTSCA